MNRNENGSRTALELGLQLSRTGQSDERGIWTQWNNLAACGNAGSLQNSIVAAYSAFRRLKQHPVVIVSNCYEGKLDFKVVQILNEFLDGGRFTVFILFEGLVEDDSQLIVPLPSESPSQFRNVSFECSEQCLLITIRFYFRSCIPEQVVSVRAKYCGDTNKALVLAQSIAADARTANADDDLVHQTLLYGQCPWYAVELRIQSQGDVV